MGDCCTDDTQEIVASFGDPRIRWHNLTQNSGNQAGPNNAGLKMARGEFTAYMHQDDLWFPEHLEVLVPAMRKGVAPLAHTLALDVSPLPENLRRIVGLPTSWGPFGPDRRQIWAVTLMHGTEHVRSLGGWRDWRELREPRQNPPPRRALLRRVRSLVPRAVRGSAGSVLRRAGSWLERD